MATITTSTVAPNTNVFFFVFYLWHAWCIHQIATPSNSCASMWKYEAITGSCSQLKRGTDSISYFHTIYCTIYHCFPCYEAFFSCFQQKFMMRRRARKKNYKSEDESMESVQKTRGFWSVYKHQLDLSSVSFSTLFSSVEYNVKSVIWIEVSGDIFVISRQKYKN